jgi:hypothetical protein
MTNLRSWEGALMAIILPSHFPLPHGGSASTEVAHVSACAKRTSVFYSGLQCIHLCRIFSLPPVGLVRRTSFPSSQNFPLALISTPNEFVPASKTARRRAGVRAKSPARRRRALWGSDSSTLSKSSDSR